MLRPQGRLFFTKIKWQHRISFEVVKQMNRKKQRTIGERPRFLIHTLKANEHQRMMVRNIPQE